MLILATEGDTDVADVASSSSTRRFDWLPHTFRPVARVSLVTNAATAGTSPLVPFSKYPVHFLLVFTDLFKMAHGFLS